jgi:SAM-dependent methyltransferase
MQQHWFKDWFNSSYYHQLYFNRDDREAESFINKLIDHLQPPGNAKMLDVACGKGRHAMQLAEKGFDVTGIDLSEESIDEALQSENDKLHFYRHDMRHPFWINYFDYTFNFFTSFGYFNTQRENDNAIRTIAQSLREGGTFVMDYLNVQYSEDHTIPLDIKEISGVTYRITKWFDEGYFYKKIVIEDKNHEEPFTYTEKVAKFTLADFKQMFAKQGMNIAHVFGDYNFADYDSKTSPRLIMIANK